LTNPGSSAWRGLSSVCAAHLKEASDEFTPEQVEELKRHYLSKSLYLNFPTTTEYTDLKEALSAGTVDTRTSYKIDVGSREILNLSKLHSANKALERLYEVTDASGKKLDKPKFEDCLDGASFKRKQLSARTKVTKVDELMMRLMDDFLGVARFVQGTAQLADDSIDRVVDAWNARGGGTVDGGVVLVAKSGQAKALLRGQQGSAVSGRIPPNTLILPLATVGAFTAWCQGDVLGIRTTLNGSPINYPVYLCRNRAQ
jgi:hypothetical protein